MKYLIAISFLMLAACGGGGGGSAASSAPGHIPDNTPHVYTAVAAALTNTNQLHPVTMHQLCNFGLSDVRDETANLVLVDPTPLGGVGCGDGGGFPISVNYVIEVTNTGTDDIYLVISIDGVNQPQEIVAPGAVYTLQRGY